MTGAAVGIVLAAGAGTRFGGPKALARAAEGTPWLRLAVATLEQAGCGEILVAVGAAADEAARLVPPGARAVRIRDWRDGLSRSLAGALETADETAAAAALVIPVDVPGLPASACRRVRDAAPAGPGALARAVYAGAPGHPALLGRDHWAGIRLAASGDTGAGAYLRAHAAFRVECGDLWDGADIDRKPAVTGA